MDKAFLFAVLLCVLNLSFCSSKLSQNDFDLIVNDKNDSDQQYTVTITAGEGGSVTHKGGVFNEGYRLNIIAVPDEGYNFIGWTGDFEYFDSNITIYINSNINLIANFEFIAPD
ncbi:MAG: InlB B-repeat-containing protein [Flavobacteriaceae bacterium]